MGITFYPANERGLNHISWLKSYHSFSFGSYLNKERMNFGMLCVLNDDKIISGEGFDTHPHNNMEIITNSLKGSLAHQDSTGSLKTLEFGDVQRMTAGTGITHSEYNNSEIIHLCN